MRAGFSLILTIMVIALLVTAYYAKRSDKQLGKVVALLLISLVPPVMGNIIIIGAHSRNVTEAGYYIYFLGMDFVMYALMRFTIKYCAIKRIPRSVMISIAGLLLIDVIQYIFNPFFRQAFSTEPFTEGEKLYYNLIPYYGQTFHRVLDYGLFFAVLIIFLIKMIRSPRIYSERYYVIFVTMVVVGLWESAYIFSRSQIDRSMIGFGVFGLLVYYFALYYRPMRLLDRMLASIASEMPEALYFFDAAERCIWANAPGITLADIKGTNFDTATRNLINLFGDIEEEGVEWSVRRNITLDGTMRYFVLEKHSVRDMNGKIVGSFLSIRDNTDEQLALQHERYAASHDRLTGLFTKEYLYESVRKKLDINHAEKYLVIYLDVSNFKMINDIFGVKFGDEVLIEIADRIRRVTMDSCIIGRLVGDTFGILMPKDEFSPERYTRELLHFDIEGENIKRSILMHVGIYEITDTTLDISVMFDRARMALTTIKDDYQTYIAYYDDEMRKKVLWEQHISNQLDMAIENKEIRPYLQPIVNYKGEVVGAEALVRWIHPTYGFLSPGLFIPPFEKNGKIAEVDRYMWKCACEILSEWKKLGRKQFISINISPKDFYFMDVAAVIKQLVKEYDVDPGQLRVEITETVMMTDIEKRINILNDLRNAGFMVEIDDFGSGYSSFNMLKDMPIDVLKIDMVFLRKTRHDSKAETILNNIIKMSDDLSIYSLTEGVETEEQYHMLTKMGCKMFQGYYFAKPMPVSDFEEYCFGNKSA